ncbi:hypothetical protein AYX14_07186 [Cryptococcus neoformans]|nr:hypothetical protein AYX14_07186 [Cryptococcus neoformans var. grubii]
MAIHALSIITKEEFAARN